MKKSSNLNISCEVVFYLNKWNKKVGSPSSFGRKRPFMSLNSCAFIENLSSSERARARARANPAENDAQEGCAMQLNGITLTYCVGRKYINAVLPSYEYEIEYEYGFRISKQLRSQSPRSSMLLINRE